MRLPVTLAVAILALAASAHPPLALTLGQERLPLPAGVRASLESSPFERRVVLRLPAAAAGPLARRLRQASRICPDVAADGDSVVLRCRTERLRASLDLSRPAQPGLELRVLSVLPWRPEEEGPPLAGFDPGALGLGSCERGSPEARGECALAAGDRDGARRLFEEAAKAGPSPLAELRLGDLALADDDPESAAAHWKRARYEPPLGRLASARLCELDAECLSSGERLTVFDPAAVPDSVRADLALRTVRITAFRGELAEAARALSGEWGAGGACRAAPAWCRHVLALALAQPGPEGAAALAVYLATPGHSEGPDALALARAAAAQAEAAGAPGFAANLLAARSGDVSPEALSGHLQRVVGLYLAAGDRARAEEIVLFARARLGAAALARPEWARARRALKAERAAARRAVPDADLASAQAALEAARLVTLKNGAAR
jgi:hypothetical protein